jgi:alpha/beta hydrolase fold
MIGHDWGGSIAWTVAMNHPEVVDRLAILNAAHPRRLSEGLKHPSQLRKSWYFFFFATPGLPEEVVHLSDWHFFRHFLQDANPPYTPEEIGRYEEAWSQEGAAAGMINYYRASVRQSQKEAAAKLRPISAPTLVIWGSAIPTWAPTSPNPTATTYPTSWASSAWTNPPIGCTTTRLNASTGCLSTSSAARHKQQRPRRPRVLAGRKPDPAVLRTPHALQRERVVSSGATFRFVAVLTLGIVVLSGSVQALADSGGFPSTWDGIWWAMVTVTTAVTATFTRRQSTVESSR